MKEWGVMLFIVVLIALLVAGAPQHLLEQSDDDSKEADETPEPTITYDPPAYTPPQESSPTNTSNNQSEEEDDSEEEDECQAPADVVLTWNSYCYNAGTGEIEFDWKFTNTGDLDATNIEVSIWLKEDGDWLYDISETVSVGTLGPGESESLYASFSDDGEWHGTENGLIEWNGGSNDWEYTH